MRVAGPNRIWLPLLVSFPFSLIASAVKHWFFPDADFWFRVLAMNVPAVLLVTTGLIKGKPVRSMSATDWGIAIGVLLALAVIAVLV